MGTCLHRTSPPHPPRETRSRNPQPSQLDSNVRDTAKYIQWVVSQVVPGTPLRLTVSLFMSGLWAPRPGLGHFPACPPPGVGRGGRWRGTVLNLWAPPQAPHCLEGGFNPPSLAEALGRPRPPMDPAEEGAGWRDPWNLTSLSCPAPAPPPLLPSGKIPEEEGESPASWPHLGLGWGCFHGFRLPAPEASSPHCLLRGAGTPTP